MKKKAASPTRPYFRALMDYQFRSGANVENGCGAGLMSRRCGVVRPRLKQDAGGFRPVHLAKAQPVLDDHGLMQRRFAPTMRWLPSLVQGFSVDGGEGGDLFARESGQEQ